MSPVSSSLDTVHMTYAGEHVRDRARNFDAQQASDAK